jgi:hypothetical protein
LAVPGEEDRVDAATTMTASSSTGRGVVVVVQSIIVVVVVVVVNIPTCVSFSVFVWVVSTIDDAVAAAAVDCTPSRD